MTNISERRLPPDLAGLPSIRAEVAFEVAPGSLMPSLEGPVFDREGNFYCCHTAPGDTTVMKITPEGEQSKFYHNDVGMTVGLAFHRDGRCFAADMLSSCINILSPDGKLLDTVSLEAGGRRMRPDCMVFRENGDLCFTDLSGHLHNPSGGVYVLRADSGYKEMELFLGELCAPDGITFAPDGRSVWITEVSTNSVIRILLDPKGNPRIAQHSPLCAYRNAGSSNVDTHAMDENGFIYVGIMMGGRALVLDKDGIPVANILAPGFEEGKLAYTPNLALRQDACEGYLVASDDERAVVLRFESLAPGQRLYATE